MSSPSSNPPAAPAAQALKRPSLRSPEKWRVLNPRDIPEGKRVFGFIAADAQLERVAGGESVDYAELTIRWFDAGDITVGVPSRSVAGDVANGFIVEANGPDDPYAKLAPAAEGEAR